VAFKDLPPNGVMLVYISADSCDSNVENDNDYAESENSIQICNFNENI
jgi:hypothetical protein